MLRIYSLGRFEVWRGRHRIQENEWRTEVHKTLLKALLTDPGRIFSHDELVEYLWPETAQPARRAKNLRARVCELRRLLDPSPRRRGFQMIRTVRGGYRLDPDRCWIDFLEMRELFDRGRRAEEEGEALRAAELYKQAARLYRGDFLPEDRHREWTHPPRERLRSVYLSALRRLLRLWEVRGRSEAEDEEAIGWAERALQADPYDEELYRALMRLHRRRGRPAEALLVYERCVDALRELDAEPAPQTRALAEAIRSRFRSRSRSGAAAPLPIRVRSPRGAAALRERLQATFGEIYRDPERAIREAGEIRARFRELGCALGEAEALCVVANARLVRADFAAAERTLEEAEGCRARHEQASLTGSAVEATDVEGAADWAAWVQLRLLAARGLLLDRRQRLAEAQALYDRALQLAEAWEFPHAEVSLLLNLGTLHYQQGRLGEAGFYWERAREQARRLGQDTVEAKACNNLALIRERIGDLEGARALYKRAIELLESGGDLQGLADAWNNLGLLEDLLGRWDEAEAAYARALELSERTQDPVGTAIEEINLGEIALQRRRYREARERLERALRQLEELEQPLWEAEALKRLAWLHQERGRQEQAAACAEEGLRRLRRLEPSAPAPGPGLLRADLLAYRALSLALAASGRPGSGSEPERREREREEALRSAREAERIVQAEAVAEAEGYRWVSVRYRLWRALEILGEKERADPHLVAAYRALEALTARIQDPEHKRSFRRVRMHREIYRAWAERQKIGA